mmetsp:Transcript_22778/g.50840  ORF Transcript_22778/g.50840 Transcript_22778/m.50840 type:complete len:86 (-) Transcript_22778:1391-1648(-)
MGSMLSFVRFDSIRFDSSRGPETNPFYLKTTTDDAFSSILYRQARAVRKEEATERSAAIHGTAHADQGENRIDAPSRSTPDKAPS